MTADTRAEVERIAKGLTKAQREAVLTTFPGESRPYAEVHGMPRVILFRAGLFESNEYADRLRFVLTPLGLAVRAYLQEGTTR